MNKAVRVKGDAVEALKAGAIKALFHCCNAQKKMNSGIAKQIRDEFPEVYKAYMEEYEGKWRVGESQWVSLNEFDGVVCNIIGQEYYGYDRKRYVNYGAVALSLDHTCKTLLRSGRLNADEQVGFPYKFGCDRAGGDWDIMSEIIEFVVGRYFTVVYYEK